MSIINALTIDVEDYYQVAAFFDVIKMADWHQHEHRVVQNTHRILELCDNENIQATFFVLGWVAEKFPELTREIASRGHEVASHGYSHQLIYEQTPDAFREETLRAKALLEDQIQAPVLGYRAASYSITNDSLWALDILAEAGFQYDSSIFPVRHDRYGIPDTPRHPYRLTTPNGAELIEFPISTKKLINYQLPVAGGGYFRLFPYWLTRSALHSINQHEHKPFVFYLHPWEVDPDQPRIKASRLSRFRHYNNLKRCEQRLKQLLKQFPFDTMRSVLKEMELMA